MKILKPLAITVAVFIILFIIAALIAPPIAKHYIIKHSKEMTGRQINMHGLYANIFTGYTRITGFEVLEQNQSDRFVSFDTLIVKTSLFRLLFNELRINRIRLVNPRIEVWQKGNHFNFSDLLTNPVDTLTSATDTLTQPQQAQDSLNEETPMAIAINNIAIIRGQLSYQDLLIGSEWNINDLELLIPGVYFSGENTDIGLHLNFSKGGNLQTRMQYNLAAGNYNLHLLLNNFAIDNTLPYLQQSMNVSQVNGVLSADLNLEGNTSHAMDITIKGSAELQNFRLADTENKDIVSAGRLFIDMEAINPEKQLFRFHTVQLQNINSYFDLYPQSNTFSQLLKAETQQDSIESPSGASPDTAVNAAELPDFTIGQLSIDHSSFTFNDHTLHKPFRFVLDHIQLSSSNFSLTGKNQVRIKSSLPNGGSILFDWTGKLTDLTDQDINLNIKNMDLKAFTPYSLTYFGYPLTEGVLAFSSINDIRNNNLDGRNSLNIYRCEVDKKRKDLKPEYNIPLRTALYILKDVNNNIKLDLPVKGDISSPAFSYKKIVIKTLTNLLIKVAVSPFSFLANSLGLVSPDLQNIPFDIHRSDFTPEQFSKINQLSAILKAKPEMILELQQSYDPYEGERMLSLFQAQKAYYLHSHPEVSDSTLQAIDYARITEINTKDPLFLDYITSMVPEEMKNAGLQQKIASLSSPEKLQQQLSLLSALRNQKLNNYLLHQGIPEKSIRISTLSADSLKLYKGKNCYTFRLTLEGEEPLTENDTPEGYTVTE